MPIPIPDPKGQEIQRIGQYIENRVPGTNGVTLASDYEQFAADHTSLTATATFFAWAAARAKTGALKAAGIDTLAAHKALGQIARGTEKGIERTGQNAIDRILGEIEKALIAVGKGIGSAVTSLPGFLSTLTQRNTWIRIAEGGIAIGLILIAANRILNNKPAQIAKTAAKVVK